MNRSKWLEIQVITLSYRGHNCREISDKLQVSLGKVSKILHKLNLEAKEEIKTWIDYRTPWEYQKSLMLLEYITKKAIEIGETTKDERVQLEAMARLAEIDAQKRQLLSDSYVINSAISTLQKERKREILVSVNKPKSTFSKPPPEKIDREANQQKSDHLKDSSSDKTDGVTHKEGESTAN